MTLSRCNLNVHIERLSQEHWTGPSVNDEVYDFYAPYLGQALPNTDIRMKPDDKSLIAGLKDGNPLVYQNLYSSYYPLMVSYANKILKDLDLSRSVSQSVIIRIFEKRDQLQIRSDLKSYLISAVHREALHERKRQIRQEDLVDVPIHHREDLLIEAENELRIWEAIDALPDRCKEIFVSNRIEGNTNQQIADSLKISKRTVETQISKALRILREKLLSVIFF